MVILVVCLWHEPDSQLFDTEATETDGNQMPFIACRYHLCVPITSVMNTTGTTWHEALSRSCSLSLCLSIRLNWLLQYNQEFMFFIFKLACVGLLHAWQCPPSHTFCECVSLCAHAVDVGVYVFVLSSVMLPRYALTQRLELQVAPGVWEQFTSCWCLSVRCIYAHMHTFIPYAHNCIFVHSIPLALTYACSCHAHSMLHECIFCYWQEQQRTACTMFCRQL